MNGRKPLTANAVLLISLILMASCNKKSLTGQYKLERFDENGMYYVLRGYSDETGGGAFEGTISQIGWSKEWIIANVRKIYRGDKDGWYVLNVKTGSVFGPYADRMLRTDPLFSRLKIYDCSEVLPIY